MSALAQMVDRHHGAVSLLAGALAPAGDDGSEARRMGLEAWEAVLGDVDGRAGAGLSLPTRLLGAVVDRAPAEGTTDDVDDVLASRDLYPSGHRWAGWRADDPADWPARFVGDPATAVRALRRLPVVLRVVLVMRDVAHLGAVETTAVLGGTPRDQLSALDAARVRLVASLDRDLGEGEPTP